MTTLHERYHIVRTLGRGGMADVHLGVMRGAGGFERAVAIKVPHPDVAAEPNLIARFLDEARIAAQIRHVNVVATLDVVEDGHNGFGVVLEYVNGYSIREIVRTLGEHRATVGLEVALRIAHDALCGLHAAHELGDIDGTPLEIVHRDVTPHNILVGSDGVAKLTDFGIARSQRRLASTRTGEVIGKLAYMPVEQMRQGPLDRRADVYSMGVVLWELLTGERLFQRASAADVVNAVLAGACQAPHEVNPRVPVPLSLACMRALDLDPDKRYATAAAYADALEAAATASGLFIAARREVAALCSEIKRLRCEALGRAPTLHCPEEIIPASPGGGHPDLGESPLVELGREDTQLSGLLGLTLRRDAAAPEIELLDDEDVLDDLSVVEPVSPEPDAEQGGLSVTRTLVRLTGAIAPSSPAPRGPQGGNRAMVAPSSPAPRGPQGGNRAMVAPSSPPPRGPQGGNRAMVAPSSPPPRGPQGGNRAMVAPSSPPPRGPQGGNRATLASAWRAPALASFASAAVKRDPSSRWPLFVTGWTTGIARARTMLPRVERQTVSLGAISLLLCAALVVGRHVVVRNAEQPLSEEAMDSTAAVVAPAPPVESAEAEIQDIERSKEPAAKARPVAVSVPDGDDELPEVSPEVEPKSAPTAAPRQTSIAARRAGAPSGAQPRDRRGARSRPGAPPSSQGGEERARPSTPPTDSTRPAEAPRGLF